MENSSGNFQVAFLMFHDFPPLFCRLQMTLLANTWINKTIDSRPTTLQYNYRTITTEQVKSGKIWESSRNKSHSKLKMTIKTKCKFKDTDFGKLCRQHVNIAAICIGFMLVTQNYGEFCKYLHKITYIKNFNKTFIYRILLLLNL